MRFSFLVFIFLLFISPVTKADNQADFSKQFLAKDFTNLLLPNSEFLGYIGNNFQRLHVEFTSIKKDAKDPSIYHVVGNTMVKENKQNFFGEIKITELDGEYFDFSNYKSVGNDTDDEYFALNPKAWGTLSAKYEFRENQSEPHSGKFSGVMSLDWLLGNKDQLLYHRVGPNDGYSNNQYLGTWTSYKTKLSKKANWGEYRIPESMFPEYDFDVGASEFSPNPKYERQGWPQDGHYGYATEKN